MTAEEGVKGLYKGLVPGVLRQTVYSSVRMVSPLSISIHVHVLVCLHVSMLINVQGVYEPIKELLGAKEASAPFWKKVSCVWQERQD